MAKRKAKEMEDASASAECTICLSNDSLDIGTLGCKHAFCFECIESWSEHENSCPLCKKRFSYIDRITKEPPGAESAKNKPPTKTRVKIKKKNQLDHPSQAAPPQYPSYGIAPSAFANMASFFSGLTGSRFRYSHDVAFNAFSGMGGFMQAEAEEQFGRRTITTGRIGGGRVMRTVPRSSTAPEPRRQLPPIRSGGGMMASRVNSSTGRGSSEPIEISDDEVMPRATSSSSATQPNMTTRAPGGSSTEVIDLTDDAVEFIPSSSSSLQRSSTFNSANQLPTQPSAHPAFQSFAQFPSLPPVPSASASMEELHSYLELLEDEFDENYEPSLRSEDMMSYDSDDGDGHNDLGDGFGEQDDEHSDLTSDNEQHGPSSRASFGNGNSTRNGNTTTEVIDLMDDDEEGFEILAPAPSRIASVPVTQAGVQPSGQFSGQASSQQAAPSAPSVADAAGRPVIAAVRPYAGVMVWCRSCESYHDKQRVWENEGYCRAMYNSLLASGGFNDSTRENGVVSVAPSSSSAQATNSLREPVEETHSSGLHLLAASAAAETSSSMPTSHSSGVEPPSASAVNADGLVDLMESSDSSSDDFLADTQFKRIRRGKRVSSVENRKEELVVSASASCAMSASEEAGVVETTAKPEPVESVPVCEVQESTEAVPESALSRTQSDATTASSRSRSQASATTNGSSCAAPDSTCDRIPLFSASMEAEKMKRTASFAMSESVSADSPEQHTRRRSGSFCDSESPMVSV